MTKDGVQCAIKVLFIIFISLYSLGSFLAFIVGAASTKSHCHEPPVRIEKYFPAYKLGCYLFQVEETK